MKKIISLMSVFILVSCKQNGKDTGVVLTDCQLNNANDSTKPLENQEKTLSDLAVTSETNPTPCIIPEAINEGAQLTANVELNGFEDPEDLEKVQQTIDKILIVINTEEFKQRVINFEFEGEKKFVDNAGLTNEEIYNVIMSGKEQLKPEVDHEMDLELNLYYSSRNTVGYTYPDVMDIYMNNKFFSYYTHAEAGGNIVHEWTHKLGFEHDFSYTYGRDASVPYAVGYIIEELINEL
jgi:hypothetical protein